MSKVEYVGKAISEDELSMPDKHIRGVNDFHKSANNTRLRLFLGFIYHLRDHVPNHSNVVSFLSKMIGTKHGRTMAYSSEEGAIVEKVITICIDVQKCLLSTHQLTKITTK